MVAQVDDAEWQAKGAAGLGSISSLSPECTPLKHRYDSCFNLWFKDYLAIGDDQIREQQRQGEASGSGTAQPAASNSGKKRSSWFSDASSSSSGSTRASSIAEPDVESSKRAIMERYDRDCGKLFNEYQACVRAFLRKRVPRSSTLCVVSTRMASQGSYNGSPPNNRGKEKE
ncbi:hypothetical protein PHSY_004952 [Pseudozyma hubeiensis SY62]|uniref:Uncharacterized protein n=1 Tax=Pseudozyma hubeiensis (strain SY62) TaxID=1305764 RepID=R9P809_PSEHS|nr:hypothetical protein PHSY_004952 [Pseudozyma hubeiensis SY62]GAC97367.1 hypothetical protein PHSY_004952 [Pseudozyma hubeiensis SY62]